MKDIKMYKRWSLLLKFKIGDKICDNFYKIEVKFNNSFRWGPHFKLQSFLKGIVYFFHNEKTT